MRRVKNVAEWLDISAERFPDKIAFSDGKDALTFAQLRDSARRIASELARRGLFKQPVLVQMGKKPQTIAAFLGCAYSGNFYTPLDPDAPAERKEKIVATLLPAEAITESNYEFFSKSLLDEQLLKIADKDQIDTDLLYVLFTSGSTGNPKGVAVHHRGVIDYTISFNRVFNLDENDIWAQTAPIVFDASIIPVYQTLYCSSQCYMIPKKILVFPSKTIEFLNKYKCSIIQPVPTLMKIIADSGALEKNKPEYIKKCIMGGELLTANLLNKWKKILPKITYANIFGPTEITDSCLFYIINRDFCDGESIPIGINYENLNVFLLNDENKLCAHGEIGEIYIRGSKIAHGYYNDFEKSKYSFVQNPLNEKYPEVIYRSGDLGYVNDNGEIIYVGRKDFQIKHAGYRIELGEIENATSTVKSVELCACIYDNNARQIVLYFTGDAEARTITDALKQKLPSYMLPGKILRVEEMPKTESGKISRVELKKRLENNICKTANGL